MKKRSRGGNSRVVFLFACGIGTLTLIQVFQIVIRSEGINNPLRQALQPSFDGTSSDLLELGNRKASIQTPLQMQYPNGEMNVFDCYSMENIEFMCGMTEGGCQGSYPQMFASKDVMQNWPPDVPDRPRSYYNSLCRYNMSDPEEQRLAYRMRQFEVPFIVYDVPELETARSKW